MTTLIALYAGLEPYTKVIVWVLGLLAPTGGLWKWWSVYKGRVHAKVRDFGPAALKSNFVRFDIENLGKVPTSLELTFTMTGYSPKKQKLKYSFRIEDKSRILQPHVERTFLAAHATPQQTDILFLWYTTWKIKLTHGQPITLRFRNAEFVPIGFFRLQWELLAFRHFTQPLNASMPAIAAQTTEDEALHLGKPQHPDLHNQDHRVAVIQIKVVNGSKTKKARITGVNAFDVHDEPMPISWSDSIDNVGNPAYCGNLVAVTDSAVIYLRHDHGNALNFARIEVQHSLPGSPATVTHDDWHVASDPNLLAGA